jgi:1-acyl-sn-glycerol-3-phosphate acyltransferase
MGSRPHQSTPDVRHHDQGMLFPAGPAGYRWSMSELVYPPVIVAAKVMFRVLDMRVRVDGAEHIPTTGGAVIACNHIGYLDFIFCGFGAQPAHRLVRFMAKKEVFDHKVSGPLMRGMHHIPVDRDAGLASYREALAALKDGQIVGVFPEATISRSFTIKEMKNGAARLAASAGVPLVPMAVWGTQRLWTKGRPKTLTKRHVPISILGGEPLLPGRRDDHDANTATLRERMSALLDQVQREYPDKPEGPDDAWWLPNHLGGTAPTLAEAAQLDAESITARGER